MNDFWLHPAAILIAGALLLPLIPERLRKGWLIAIPLLTFARTLFIQFGYSASGAEVQYFGEFHFGEWKMAFGRVDKLSLVFAHIMSLMAVVGSLYSLHVKRVSEHVAAWGYAASAIGALFAGDFLTLFLFWELMAFSSVFLIWQRGRAESLRAGYRYLLVHMAGGVSLLAGILLHYQANHCLSFVPLDVANPSLATYLIAIGFILNAAVPPLHAWLPDAYGEATFNGSVFLCAFTTKTAVYALLRGVPGLDLLVPLGVIMALYGVVYAVLENDSRRLLAYHIISQVGYMVAGAGMADTSTEFGRLAFNGVCAHAFAHILYKGLLFMGCGTVLHQTGESRFTRLGGLYQKMPWTFLFTLIGGLSISAFPLFSGFVSKSMIVAAGFEGGKLWVGFLLMLASAGTFLHTGLKVPYFVFFGKNNCSEETWQRAKDPVWNMNAAMALASFLCIFIGCYTPYLYNMLPQSLEHAYHPYSAHHISETMQVLCFTALGFFLFIKKLTPEAKISLDLDWPYRKGGAAFLWLARKPIQTIDTAVGEAYRVIGLNGTVWLSRFVDLFDRTGIDGVVDGLAEKVRATGQRLRSAQSGAVQANLAITFAVAAVIVAALVYFVA